ncbi:MAG TPA: glutamate racemase [Bdellovibrionales bacterium]|nr:glutamate racemase [Bdellovibrionales bacterium]
MADSEKPIGVFDSGIGGLTVLKTLIARFPNESFVYLGDTARLPYGSKSPKTIERYLLQNIEFLLNQNVKAAVVACNSASTVLLSNPSLAFPVPVYNVIEPGAATAVRESEAKRIGVLGTKATVGAKSYVQAIHRLDREAVVFQQACPLLVPLVEEGWEDDPITNLVVYRYIQPIIQAKVDTLILGCTHYPALRLAFEKVAGPHIRLVDSSLAISDLIDADFASGRLARGSKPAPLRLMTTDVSQSFFDVAARLMNPVEIPQLEAVDIGTPKP